jgi:AraC-like DNA-binding protein
MEGLRQNNKVLYRWVHIDVALKIIVSLAGMARGLWPANFPIVDIVFAFAIILDLTVGTFFILLHPKILEGLQPVLITFEPLFQLEVEKNELDEPEKHHSPVNDQIEIQPNNPMSTEHLKLIETFFQSNKPFLKDEFSREQLSKEIKISLRQITQAIKSGTNLNFSEYVNGYRIRHLEEQYKQHPEWKNFTIDAIGEQIGFTSRMTFYNATRKHRNLTPSELLKHLRSEL